MGSKMKVMDATSTINNLHPGKNVGKKTYSTMVKGLNQVF